MRPWFKAFTEKRSQELSTAKAEQSASKVEGTRAVARGKAKGTEGDKVRERWTRKKNKEQIFPNKNYGISSSMF